MKIKIGKILIFIILALGLVVSFNSAFALDTGVSEVSEVIELGGEDPRSMIGRIINIAMIFLSVIAVGIILFAGFKWMTSEGNEEKVSSAKKTLTSGVIGLVIVLSSWGIASFVLAQLVDSTGGGGGTSSSFCETGDSQSCGCGGSQICLDGSWGTCVGSDCGTIGGGDGTCDGNTLTPTCDADNNLCLDGYICDDTSCLCSKVSVGDSCDADEDTPTCEIDNSACGTLLTCDLDSCLCIEDESIDNSSSSDAPFILSYEPDEAPEGQYVTIAGSNFGNSQGLSRIYFGDVEADYSFPDICLDSIWSDSQVIVKVPEAVDGNYIISLEARGYTVDTDANNLDPFEIDNSLAVKPSLCKIEPTMGPANSPVILWGEYFGNNGSSIVTRFYSDRDQISVIDSGSLVDNVETTVHTAAFSGPVKVINNGIESNSLNFKVGSCSQDKDCGVQKCCPAGTYKEGICTDSISECYVDVPSSVYEWRFSTDWRESDPDVVYDSCMGMARIFGACATDEFCPNSPGLCSPYAGGGTNIIGVCDYSCLTVSGCEDGNCEYDNSLDKCVDIVTECDYGFTTYNILGGEVDAYCDTYNGADIYHMSTDLSCPNGWYNIGDSTCVNDGLECTLCPDSLTCFEDSGVGTCISKDICKQDGICSTDNKCVETDSASCDCCCEIGQDARDCCVPLTCGGTCGNDASDDGAGYGVCSGCTDAGNTTAEQDAACNCIGTSGKYCDTSIPTGACVDCAQLSGFDECSAHSESCCYDAVNDSCAGGDGTVLEGVDAGYCAYYSCDVFSPEQCNYTASKIGEYRDTDSCDSGCFNNPSDSICSTFDGDMSSCMDYSGCCYNYVDDKCVGGDQTIEGYCDYYTCDLVDTDQCSAIPNRVSGYENFLSCSTACSSPPAEGLGQSCTDISEDSCAPSICSSPFSCIDSYGDVDSSECGYCCCDPNGLDVCGDLSPNLTCVANQGSCSGADRGLCCGCEDDGECGNAESIGCGLDTCCHARPDIRMNEVSPSHLETGICRNASIIIPFDSKMNVLSLNNNVLLLEEHNSGETCPAGTYLVGNNIPTSNIARLYKKVLSYLSPVTNIFTKKTTASLPDSNKVYCSVTGSVHSFNMPNGTTEVSFIPSQELSSNTNYYVVVRGDESLDSTTGVLSIEEIGMNGRGYNELGTYVEGENVTFNDKDYKNSYIWEFTTLGDQAVNSGNCIIDYVTVEPDGYLFQTTENDLNENDSNVNDNSFDTVKDGDKAFIARAFSVDDQELYPVGNYQWDWDWNIDNTSILGFKTVNELNNNGKKRLVYANPGIVDGNALVKITTNMDAYSNMSTIGDDQQGSAKVYVFICSNPWPSIDPINGTWNPWGDEQLNCNAGSGNCSNYNYSFYYCRDDGGEGVRDDLPAVLDDEAVISGASNLVCSDGSGTCTIFGATCGVSGVCQWNVLKEFYFFNETPVNFGELISVTDSQAGGEVQLSWKSGTTTTEYSIYYKLAAIDELIEETVLPLSVCSEVNNEYHCSYDIDGLINNEVYNFYISALVNDNDVFLNNEVSATPTLAE